MYGFTVQSQGGDESGQEQGSLRRCRECMWIFRAVWGDAGYVCGYSGQCGEMQCSVGSFKAVLRDAA